MITYVIMLTMKNGTLNVLVIILNKCLYTLVGQNIYTFGFLVTFLVKVAASVILHLKVETCSGNVFTSN